MGLPCTDAKLETVLPEVDYGRLAIDTEMVSLEMVGTNQVVGELKIRLADGQKTLGQILQSEEAMELGVDVSEDAPAHSYFDVYFVVESEDLGESEVIGPVRAEAELPVVPPGRVSSNIPPDDTAPVEEPFGDAGLIGG